ncbi:MAG: 16S rRNA (uracil(1498)-N(3))-methyltransferase [Clostridia bacterium]|nr:16S rRNA (uracil(1498)-N(3))-methyltransferase [Clostridia bacterium]
MIRLFIESPLFLKAKISLNEKQNHYLFHVMRQKKGNELALFNGKDGEWIALIVEISKSKLIVECQKQSRFQKDEKSNALWLCFAPIKKENMDFIVQKATELGVEGLYPVVTQRTIAKVNVSRMKLQAIEAAEQCERLSVPPVAEPVLLKNFLNTFPKGRRLCFLNERNEGSCQFDVQNPIAFLVGPEGGFDEQELSLIQSYDYAQSIHFGRRILRAETACLVALASYHQTLLWKM